MGVDELIGPQRDMILRIAAKHGAHNVRVFGSVARGDAGRDSDVDLLIDAGATTSAWFPGGLVADLEAVLGRRVDVVTERGLMPELRPHVLREAVPV
jgi:uncharacterized protein